MMRSWTRRNGSNPLGSLSLHPRCGKIRADVNRQIIQDSPYGRGRSAFEILVWFRLGRLRVFGRLPVTDSATRPRAGVRKASREETAGGVCAGGGVGLWGFSVDVGADPPVWNRDDG